MRYDLIYTMILYDDIFAINLKINIKIILPYSLKDI